MKKTDKRRSKPQAKEPELSEAELDNAVGGVGAEQPLNLQQKMQNESRQYTAVSNILKTKHDTAKNSISNIR
jgi:hypothetical protein